MASELPFPGERTRGQRGSAAHISTLGTSFFGRIMMAQATMEARPVARLKSISVRKAGPVRLTSAAHPLYGGGCTGVNKY
jgi:hypothetical protein